MRGCLSSAAQVRHEGRIRAGGVEKDVTFVEETDPRINDGIDAAYRNKYGRYSAQYVDPMVAADARATTMKLVPRLLPCAGANQATVTAGSYASSAADKNAQTITITRSGSQLSRQGPAQYFTGTVRIDRSLRRSRRRARPAVPSPSSPARDLHGTPIRSVKS